ncbi:putative lipid phosphatase [Blastocystis sp. subtype 4]|uniref:putative lipid phosphatase n=1 Tax=Blastocystis sp. subtype 4 TaxID=944170 RepID=UPI00071228FC|nr:putative lipid phosphatase [Blastocystis sp. subtype 4]KNB44530.1 putative lipid phosphatase [Blastocystis sp. subtype 4]|eukprot:XP_014527966.1 putative lipid phosphatase [Blastocystis sp. subtype 4]
MPKQLVFGWTLSMFMIVATYYIETIPPKFTEFFEGDIALSYSVHDTVPYKYVIISCFVIPVIICSLFIVICNPKDAPVWIHDLVFVSVRSYAFDEIVVVLLKNFIGRPRPCFFQLCQYENTTSILPSGDIRVTFGNFGVMGDVRKCRGTKESIYNAFRSFPSGHSATSVNGLLTVLQFLYRFIDTTFSLKQYQVRLLKGFLSIPFIAWVGFILGSRIVFDYRHRPEDVIGGMVIGSLSSVFIMKLFHPFVSNSRRIVNDLKNKGAPYTWSRFFSDTSESIVNVYSPVSKPESAIV